MEKLNFGLALDHLKLGNKVARVGWNGKGMYVAIQVRTVDSFMTLPYIYMFTADKQRVPWLASQTDLLEDDWFVVV